MTILETVGITVDPDDREHPLTHHFYYEPGTIDKLAKGYDTLTDDSTLVAKENKKVQEAFNELPSTPWPSQNRAKNQGIANGLKTMHSIGQAEEVTEVITIESSTIPEDTKLPQSIIDVINKAVANKNRVT